MMVCKGRKLQEAVLVNAMLPAQQIMMVLTQEGVECTPMTQPLPQHKCKWAAPIQHGCGISPLLQWGGETFQFYVLL